MSRSRILPGTLLAALVLLVGACGGSTTGADPTTTTDAAPAPSAEFSGYVRNPPADVSEVRLPIAGAATEGDTETMVAPDDGLLIVFFGYATCPDICPLTLGVLRSAIANQPAADRERVQVAMVTVDPSRDTDELLAQYVQGYFPDGLALRTADPEELRGVADAFGANFTSRENMDGNREIAHSAELYVIDDTGMVVLAWPYGVTPEAITADLARLLDGERPTADA